MKNENKISFNEDGELLLNGQTKYDLVVDFEITLNDIRMGFGLEDSYEDLISRSERIRHAAHDFEADMKFMSDHAFMGRLHEGVES